MTEPMPSSKPSGIPQGSSPSPAPPRPNPTTTNRKRVSELPKPAKRKRMTDEEKLEDVFKYMRETYRWTLNDLLETTERYRSDNRFARAFASLKRFALNFTSSSSCYDTKKVEKDYYIRLSSRIGGHVQKELEELQKTPSFGKCKNEIADFDDAIRNATTVLLEKAPLLVAMIRSSIHNYRPGDRTAMDELPVEGRSVIVAAILGHMAHRNTFESIQTTIGLYLYSNGARTRAIETFARLGLSRGIKHISKIYKSIEMEGRTEVRHLAQSNDAVFTYDNFEYTANRRGERIGHRRTFNSITTALVTNGRLIPNGGLTQDMWKSSKPLMPGDVFKHVNVKDCLFIQSRKWFIHISIMRAMQIDTASAIYSRFQAPIIQPMNPTKTAWHPCAPIHVCESFTENNITIIEDLYLKQSGRSKDDPWFVNGLSLCAGDQKTVDRMLSVKKLGMQTATKPFDRYQWLLPIPGLWHLKLNYLLMLLHVHKNPGTPVDITSLQYAIDKWDRSGLMNRENFKDMEELVIHSYGARTVGLLIRYMMEKHRHLNKSITRDYAEVKKWIERTTLDSWETIIEWIFQSIHSLGATVNIYDEVRTNEMKLCRHIEVYMLLDHAIRSGDLGLLRRALAECTLLLQAKEADKPRYAKEMLRVMHMIDSQAATSELQEAVLANCLGNLRGRPDTHLARDLMLELHNGAMKEAKRCRETSTKEIGILLDEVALSSQILQKVKAAFESLGGWRPHDSRHPRKVDGIDIFILAIDLVDNTLDKEHTQANPRFTVHPSPDLYSAGRRDFMQNLVQYNARSTGSITTEEDELEELEGALDATIIMDGISMPLTSVSVVNSP